SGSCAPAETQDHFAEPDSELAHYRSIKHDLIIDHVHPVVKIHFPGSAVDIELQHIPPAQRVALHFADGLSDDIVRGAAVAVGSEPGEGPHPAAASAVRIFEMLVEDTGVPVPPSIEPHVNALDALAAAILE